MRRQLAWDSLVGLLLVLGLHGAALYGLWSYRLLPAPQEAMTLFVSIINPPPVEKKLEPPPPPQTPRKVRLAKPQPVTALPQPVLVANAPVLAPSEPVAPPPPPPVTEPVVEAPSGSPAPEPVAPPAAPAGPLMLASDLAVACPQRVAPEYPPMSRRLKEQGKVVLRVELDEGGQVMLARVKESSGYRRLDEAGLAAVKQWHCNTPMHNGEPVKAVALQPFNFMLEGR